MGIETLGGVCTHVIEVGESVPAAKSEVFSTATDDQDQIKIKVCRGPGALTSQNHQVASFQIYGIPPAKRGTPQIEVTFRVSRDGDISVEARDAISKLPAKIRGLVESSANTPLGHLVASINVP